MTTAYIHEDDGAKWVRLDDGAEQWDEPITGWELIFDLIRGGSYLRHKDGRYIREGFAPFPPPCPTCGDRYCSEHEAHL